MRKLINNLIRKLGRENYEIDRNISKIDILKIVLYRAVQVLRGFMIKIKIKKSDGLIFAGRNVKVRFGNKIEFGRSIILGNNVNIMALSKKGVKFGNNVTILDNTIIECTGVISELGEGLEIGNNVGISQGGFIQVRGDVKIGNNVIFGPGVSIFSENHNAGDLNKYINEQGTTRKGVEINNGVWVGTKSTILDGVVIGENSIIGAGSLVNKDVPPFSIAAGIPIKIIKSRLD